MFGRKKVILYKKELSSVSTMICNELIRVVSLVQENDENVETYKAERDELIKLLKKF